MENRKYKFIILLLVILSISIFIIVPLYSKGKITNPIIAKSNVGFQAHLPLDKKIIRGNDSLQKFFYFPLNDFITKSKYSVKHFNQRMIIRDTIFDSWKFERTDRVSFHVILPDIVSSYPISNNRFIYDYSIDYVAPLPRGFGTSNAAKFIESFIATSDGNIIAIDTLIDTVRANPDDPTGHNYNRINSVFFRDKTTDSIVYYLSYDKDWGTNRFRIKTFSIQQNEIKLIDSRSIPDGFEDTLENAYPLNFCLVPHQNGKDWWFVLFSIHDGYCWGKYVRQGLRNIRTYLLQAVPKGMVISSRPVYSQSFALDSSVYFAGSYDIIGRINNSSLCFAPNGKLMCFLMRVAYVKYNPYYVFTKTFIYVFRFDNMTGKFYPFDSTLSLDKSRIYNTFRYQFQPGADTGPVTYYGNHLGYYSIATFSFDSKKLYYGRYAYDLTLSNLDTISHRFIKWLPDSLTPLEALVKIYGITNIDSFPSEAVVSKVGKWGTIYQSMYFPIPTGKFLLLTLNDVDTLSTGLFLDDMNALWGYLTDSFQLKVYEVSNPNDPKNINIKFLFSDTLFADSLWLDRSPEVFQMNRVFLYHPSLYYEYIYGDITSPLRAFSNSPVCENTDVILKSTLTENLPNTSFRWVGPNGYEATGDSVVIPSAKLMHSGWYYCYATVGDTTYSDSVEVEVVPTPAIHFLRGLPVTVCKVDSVELEIDYPRIACCDYFILWSTGDTTNRVVLRKEGWYWVKVWNELGCMDSVGFEVKFNHPLDVSITTSRDWLCGSGDSLELNVESDGSSYVWSDGVRGRQRMVYTPGRYTVVVTNEYGCVDSASIDIREEIVDLKMESVVDFGSKYIGESSERRVLIENVGGNDVKIGRVRYLGSSYEVDASKIEGKQLERGAKEDIEIIFAAKEYGENRGEIIVSVDSPCVVDYRIELLGVGKGKVLVWSPWDTVARVGWEGYCVPVYSKVVEGKAGGEYNWRGILSISSKLLRGDDGTIEVDRRKKRGFGVEVMSKDEEKRLMVVCGDVMMSGRRYELVELDSFDFGEYVDVEVRNGRVQIVGVCMPELSEVERFMQLVVNAKEVVTGAEIELEVLGERGKEYRLRIYDIMGNVVEELSWEKGIETETILLDGGTYGRGIFLIEVTDGIQTARVKLLRY